MKNLLLSRRSNFEFGVSGTRLGEVFCSHINLCTKASPIQQGRQGSITSGSNYSRKRNSIQHSTCWSKERRAEFEPHDVRCTSPQNSCALAPLPLRALVALAYRTTKRHLRINLATTNIAKHEVLTRNEHSTVIHKERTCQCSTADLESRLAVLSPML